MYLYVIFLSMIILDVRAQKTDRHTFLKIDFSFLCVWNRWVMWRGLEIQILQKIAVICPLKCKISVL